VVCGEFGVTVFMVGSWLAQSSAARVERTALWIVCRAKTVFPQATIVSCNRKKSSATKRRLFVVSVVEFGL
jgi:hypothetical protein